MKNTNMIKFKEILKPIPSIITIYFQSGLSFSYKNLSVQKTKTLFKTFVFFIHSKKEQKRTIHYLH